MDEKARESSPMEDSRAPTIVPSINDEKYSAKAAEADTTDGSVEQTHAEHTPAENAEAKEFYGRQEQENDAPLDPKEAAAVELRKIQTSDEGNVYPTGLKLGLISLALCLSVFLMALVSQPYILYSLD